MNEKNRNHTRLLAGMMLNPAKAFDTPKDVLAEPALSSQEKMGILDNWADEQKQKMQAAQENMPLLGAHWNVADAASLLQSIASVRRAIRAAEKPSGKSS